MTIKLHTAIATHIGGRSCNADAAEIRHTSTCVGAAVVDGIGSRESVRAAAREAAEAAAIEAADGNAQSAIMTAAQVIKDNPDEANAVAAVASVDVYGNVEIAHVGDCAVWTWLQDGGLTRWTVDQTVGEHVSYMLAGAELSTADRAALERAREHLNDAVSVLGDYILNTLNDATVPTVSWTVIRDLEPDLVLLTSDGVHKPLAPAAIESIVAEHWADPEGLAHELVLAAVTAERQDLAAVPDNATVAVIALGRQS